MGVIPDYVGLIHAITQLGYQVVSIDDQFRVIALIDNVNTYIHEQSDVQELLNNYIAAPVEPTIEERITATETLLALLVNQGV